MPTRREVAAVLEGLRVVDAPSDPRLRESVATSVATALQSRDDMTADDIGRVASRASLARTDVSELDQEDSLCGEDAEDAEEGEDALMDLGASGTFEVEVVEERAVAVEPATSSVGGEATKRRRDGDWRNIFGINFQRPQMQLQQRRVEKEPLHLSGESTAELDRRGNFDSNFLRPRQLQKPETHLVYEELPSSIDAIVETEASSCTKDDDTTNDRDDESSSKDRAPERRNSLLQSIADDFVPQRGGDFKLLRAIGRTAAVNAAVLVTAATGGAAGAVGYAAGGAITSKRLVDGLVANDDKEVTKSLAVYGCATGASVAGQAITGAVMIGLAGASLPLAGAVAFGVGCCSGITAGALSEWTVDRCMDNGKDAAPAGTRKIESIDAGCAEE